MVLGKRWLFGMILSELQEQIEIVRRLRLAGLLFCSVPNGGKRGRGEAIRLKASGVSAGVPDLLIFEPCLGGVGCALEMKRADKTPCSVSKVQKKWLADLQKRGWVSLVAYGASDALSQLRGIGYVL